MKKYLLFISLMFVVLTTLVIIYAQTSISARQENGERQQASSAPGQKKIKSEKHIKARQLNVPDYTDISSLSRDSALVVIGIPQQATPRLFPPNIEKIVVTNYRVEITKILQGKVNGSDQQIIIDVPGGFVQSEDGSTIEMKMPDGWKTPEIGRKYLFFLMADRGNYALVGGPQGLFEIKGSNKMESQADGRSDLNQKYNGKSYESFLNELNSVINQRP